MADLNSTLVRGNLRVTDEITTDNLEATSITENGTALSNKYQAKGSYLPTSGGAMTGPISYQGTQATYQMIKWLDNTGDTYGNGISIGGGGAVVIGSGESSDSIVNGAGVTGGTETLYLGSDSYVYLLTNVQSGYSSAKTFAFTDSGNLLVPGSISEGGTALSSKYLGISSKAADSDLLDGHDSSYFINTSNIGSQSVNYATSAGTADDLSSSATPDIASLTANGVYTPTIGTLGNLTLEYGLTPAGQTHRGVVFKGAIESYGVTLYSPNLTGNVSVMLPNANGTLATQEWVANQGYTSNTGTVTSITIQTGTGLTGGSSTASTTTGSWTIGIDSSYKLPTTSEWNSKSSVSGVNDGTNWTSITINGVTKNIPSGGSGSLTLDDVSDGTTRKLNQVTAATGKAKLGVLVAGVKPYQTGDGYLELSDTSLYQGTTTYFRDRIEYGGSILTLPTSTGTLALTSDIKHVYRHTCLVYINYCAYKIIFYNTSNASTSLYDIMKNADGQVLSNVYLIGEMLAITSVYKNGSYVQIDADHYYKNNSNYMIRAQWTAINVEFNHESIEEV